MDILGHCSEELLNTYSVFVILFFKKNIIFQVALKPCFYTSIYYSYFWSKSLTISFLTFLEKF